MSARMDAIDAMVELTTYEQRYELGPQGITDWLGAMLDEIPDKVLERLLYERTWRKHE